MSRLPTTGIVALASALFFCQGYAPVTPLRLNKPVITGVTLSEAKFATYREAVHIEWEPPASDSIAIRSFTLLRKTADDSLFDVFTRSQGIPDTVFSFNDDLTLQGFPLDGYALIVYRVFAVDTLGRAGDTSAACSLYIAPQPELSNLDTSKWCFSWLSRGIQGSVTSRLKLWNDAVTVVWTSTSMEELGNEQVPVNFSVCLPDSLKPPAPGAWHFALFLEANGLMHQSMKTGAFDVP